MKKTILILLFLLATFVQSMAQEKVILTFTANDKENNYCAFDEVSVTNITRGWTETLAYPDTVLVLTSTLGLGEQFGLDLRLSAAFPNPFTDETNVFLEMFASGDVLIQVIRIDGVVVATSRNHLEAGSHCVKVGLSNPCMAFLVVTTAKGVQVTRMICTSGGGRDSIMVDPVSKDHNPFDQFMPSSIKGEFLPGDVMRYSAILNDGDNTYNSKSIIQQQYESQVVTLIFDLPKPFIFPVLSGALYTNKYFNNVLIGHPRIYHSDTISQEYVNIGGYTATGNNGNTDLYHMYDELASTYPHYFRRTADLATVTDTQTGIEYTIRTYEMNYNNRWMIDHEPDYNEIITNGTTNLWESYGVEPRKIILVSGVYGEEHTPAWGMMLALQEVLSSDEDWAHYIKDNFVFKIIPCLNPAGWSNCRRGASVYDATANPPHYHVLNCAESMEDPEAVAYLNFMEVNNDSFILIDNHGTQGHYMNLPVNYSFPIADMVNLMATKLASTLAQDWYNFYESFGTGFGSTYAPYCVAKATFSPPSNGTFSTRALSFGLNYMNTETPDNLDRGGHDDSSDIRCCKLTKDVIINIIQMVCPLPSLGNKSQINR